MSEGAEVVESGPEGPGPGIDPIAVALALGGASRHNADAFLDDQRALIADQRHHLHEQFKHLQLGIWEKQLGVMLRVATMVMGLVVASALGLMVWQASQSNGLIVEPFSVPPEMAQRGLTGQVVAARVLDRLSQLQADTNTARPAKSYTNAWDEHGIKLEIPEAGISLAELDNWLRQKLGHDVRVTGEMVRDLSGVTITARAGDEGAESVSGADSDVNALVNKLAESIYRLTQPYRYAAYLLRHEGKPADAMPIFKRLALTGSPDDRLWSYNMWGATVAGLQGTTAAMELWRKNITEDPDAIGSYDNLAPNLANAGLYEEALQTFKDQLVHLKDGRQRYTPPAGIPARERMIRASISRLQGAYGDALPNSEQLYRSGSPGLPAGNLLLRLVTDQIGVHEISAAEGNLTSFFPDPQKRPWRWVTQIAEAREDWKIIPPTLADASKSYLAKYPKDRDYIRDSTAPHLALALAKLGNIADAERTIAPTSSQCYPCLIVRGQIAELEGNQANAVAWFLQATRAAPSFPFAHYEWGKAMLARGRPDAALEQFEVAHEKTPHFADALEGWGEALMAKNQSHLALTKFTEAEKYAPNWGRLHLKWGEALAYAGEHDLAGAQFARAAHLDLTPSEKSELAKITYHHP